MSSTFPFGVRFCPTDEELITCYLKNMVKNQPLPSGWDRVMIVRDIYGEHEGATPWILFRDDDPWQTTVVDPLGKVLAGQKVIYVFTRLSNVGKTGEKNKNRKAGCGQWHGNTSQLSIRKNGGTGELIGKKRTFTFKSEEETVGQWIMHEYELDGASLAGVNSKDNYVLCKIKKDDSKSSKGGRLVSRKNSMHYAVESNDQDGIEATAECLENKRKSVSEEGYGQWMNKKLRCDPIEKTSEPDTTNTCGEQTDGSQLITSAVFDDRSSLNYHRKSMDEAGGRSCSDNGTQWPGIMDEGEEDIASHAVARQDYSDPDIRNHPTQETSSSSSTMDSQQRFGEQVVEFQPLTSGMDNGLMMKDQSQRMEQYGISSHQTRCLTMNCEVTNIASSTVDAAFGDVGYVYSDADTCFDIDELLALIENNPLDELLALIENNPLDDAEQIDGFQHTMELGDSSVADGAQNNETDLGDSSVADGAQTMHKEGGTSGNGTDQSTTLNDQEANIATINNQGADDNILGDGDDYTSFDPNLVLGDDIYLTPPDDDDLENFWEELYSNPSSLFDLNPSP